MHPAWLLAKAWATPPAPHVQLVSLGGEAHDDREVMYWAWQQAAACKQSATAASRLPGTRGRRQAAPALQWPVGLDGPIVLPGEWLDGDAKCTQSVVLRQCRMEERGRGEPPPTAAPGGRGFYSRRVAAGKTAPARLRHYTHVTRPHHQQFGRVGR